MNSVKHLERLPVRYRDAIKRREFFRGGDRVCGLACQSRLRSLQLGVIWTGTASEHAVNCRCIKVVNVLGSFLLLCSERTLAALCAWARGGQRDKDGGSGRWGQNVKGCEATRSRCAESPLQVRGPRGGWLAFPGAPLEVSSRDRGTRELGVPQASVAGSAPSTPLLADWLQTGSVFKLCFSLSLSQASFIDQDRGAAARQVH